jgi:hypothetical protein
MSDRITDSGRAVVGWAVLLDLFCGIQQGVNPRLFGEHSICAYGDNAPVKIAPSVQDCWMIKDEQGPTVERVEKLSIADAKRCISNISLVYVGHAEQRSDVPDVSAPVAVSRRPASLESVFADGSGLGLGCGFPALAPEGGGGLADGGFCGHKLFRGLAGCLEFGERVSASEASFVGALRVPETLPVKPSFLSGQIAEQRRGGIVSGGQLVCEPHNVALVHITALPIIDGLAVVVALGCGCAEVIFDGGDWAVLCCHAPNKPNRLGYVNKKNAPNGKIFWANVKEEQSQPGTGSATQGEK